jgi:hypothetical protein
MRMVSGFRGCVVLTSILPHPDTTDEITVCWMPRLGFSILVIAGLILYLWSIPSAFVVLVDIPIITTTLLFCHSSLPTFNVLTYRDDVSIPIH